MEHLGGLSDSPKSVIESPAACDKCGATARVSRGVCVSCLLREGVADEGETSSENFESILAEADVPDKQWRLGNYQILGEIGRGGMGVIYRARQRHSRRIVALKRVLAYHSDSHERLQRFRREAEAAASLDHPNILPIYEVSESEEGLPFFSMKWATGGSLRDVGPSLRENPRACVQLLAKVARAIEYAHGRGILHRDLQPGNVLLDGHGEPLVSDFGLAKWLGNESDLTQTLTTFGTPGYIAPEQAEGPAGDLTPAADIYSLGAILFNLLAGRPPFLGANALSVIRQAAEMPAPNLRLLAPALDRDLETILARCLDRDPAARYASAGALAEDLERWLDGRPIVARPVLPPARLWRWSRRNPVLAFAACACLSLGASVIWLLSKPEALKEKLPAMEKSIAVLPFENLNQDPENGFFTDGMQEDILTNLGKVAELKVISRSSVREYKPNQPRNLREIAKELGVRHILEGSVRRSDQEIRITAHLTDVVSGTQLWAEQYDRKISDVFAIQSEISRQIADQLQARLSFREKAVIRAKPTEDILAYELYLRAKDIGEEAGLTTTVRTEREAALLEQAIARDAGFVSALCLLARVHVLSYWSNLDHTPARLEAARQALETATRLQPDGGEVHLTRGIVHYWGFRNYAAALEELELAGRALPNDADVPYFTGLILRRKGDWEGSTRSFERARGMDPRNNVTLFDLARTNYFALKRYEDSARICESLLAWKPDDFDFLLTRAKIALSSRADLARWQEVVSSDATKRADPELVAFERLDLALWQRDYRAAESALAAQSFPEFNWSGYVTPRDYYIGLIAQGLGRAEEARVAFGRARKLVSGLVENRPDDAKAHIGLAQIDARLGNKEEAILEGEHALRLRPLEKDAVDGANIMSLFAGVCAQVGEKDRALDMLEAAFLVPNFTNYGSLKLDDCWDSIRSDSRFQRIVTALAPKEGSR